MMNRNKPVIVMKRNFEAKVDEPRWAKEEIYSHQYNINNAKPVLVIAPPRSLYGSTGGGTRSRVMDATKTQRFASRTILSCKKMPVKSAIDRSEPKTFGLISKLSANKKQNNFCMTEHMRNIESLQKRLVGIESGSVC